MQRIVVPPTSLSRDTLHFEDFARGNRLSDDWYFAHWFRDNRYDNRPLIDSSGYILSGYWGVEAAIALGIPLVEVDSSE